MQKFNIGDIVIVRDVPLARTHKLVGYPGKISRVLYHEGKLYGYQLEALEGYTFAEEVLDYAEKQINIKETELINLLG